MRTASKPLDLPAGEAPLPPPAWTFLLVSRSTVRCCTPLTLDAAPLPLDADRFSHSVTWLADWLKSQASHPTPIHCALPPPTIHITPLPFLLQPLETGVWLLMFGATVVVALSVAVLECPWWDLLLGGGPAVSASDIWRRWEGCVEVCGGSVNLLLGAGPGWEGWWRCVDKVSSVQSRYVEHQSP